MTSTGTGRRPAGTGCHRPAVRSPGPAGPAGPARDFRRRGRERVRDE
ncbi:hypothetical protein KPATCC21470_8637 [Kitasatospora purpeofusca]